MDVRRHRRGRKGNRLGFTLIELLVVIAIIALLISILLPSLDAARRSAKRSACLANMKNIATSSRVYTTDDAAGFALPVHPLFYAQTSGNITFIGAYEWGGKSGIGRSSYLGDATDPLNSKYGTKAGFGPARRPLNDVLYTSGFKDNLLPTLSRLGATNDTELNLPIYNCPADDGPPRGGHCPDWLENSERSSFDHFGTSYAANIFMTYNPYPVDSPVREAQPIYSNSPYLRPLTRVATPMRTLYYEENIGRWAWAARRDVCGGIQGINPGPTKAIRGWHGKDWTYNRSFCDGHAEYQRIADGDEDQNGFMNHYRIEELSYVPEGREWENMMCIVVRGPGWQKDTLPEPRIVTHLLDHNFGYVRAEYEDCVSP